MSDTDTPEKRKSTHVSISGEAEQQLKAIHAKVGGNLPQIVRQAIKMLYDFHFPVMVP